MAHSIGSYGFDTAAFCPRTILDMVTEVRVTRSGLVKEAAEFRIRRKRLTSDGRLTILAADHPARGVIAVGDDPLAISDRAEYLGRVLRVMVASQFDGVMGTTDIIEELFIVDALVKQAGGTGFLDNKVILGSMNRGGVVGTIWELDDRFTSFTAETIADLRLDGAKIMVRLEDGQPACIETMEGCVRAINELNSLKIPVFLESLPVEYADGKYKVQKEAGALARIAGIASAWGNSSLNMWLKLPYCPNYEKVARSTTLPILMLGGASRGDPTPVLEEFAAGMKAGTNVRGALVGRNILYPGPDDPYATAMAVHSIVHSGLGADEAADYLAECRGENMDSLTKWLG
jgi:hypothetical protein